MRPPALPCKAMVTATKQHACRDGDGIWSIDSQRAIQGDIRLGCEVAAAQVGWCVGVVGALFVGGRCGAVRDPHDKANIHMPSDDRQ